MKSVTLGAMVPAIAMAVAGAAWAQPLSFGPMEGDRAGGFVLRVQDDCEDLRRACLDKDAMGERGQAIASTTGSSATSPRTTARGC